MKEQAFPNAQFIGVCVYNMCVCVCVCVFMNGCVLECHPFTAVSCPALFMTELLNGFHIFSKLCSVTDTVVHRCVSVCVDVDVSISHS